MFRFLVLVKDEKNLLARSVYFSSSVPCTDNLFSFIPEKDILEILICPLCLS